MGSVFDVTGGVTACPVTAALPAIIQDSGCKYSQNAKIFYRIVPTINITSSL